MLDLKNLFSIFLVIISSLLGSAFASDYPRGYEYDKICDTHSDMTVCLSSQVGGPAVLKVHYNGMLASKPNLSVYVQIADKGHLFAMKPSHVGQVVTIGKIHGVYRCLNTKAYTYNRYPPCIPFYEQSPEGQVIWSEGEINSFEKDFMSDVKKGQEPQYIEVSFVDGEGQWDSQYGQNYHFVLY